MVASWDLLGAFWAPLGDLLDALGTLSDALGEFLGHAWADFGVVILGVPGRT